MAKNNLREYDNIAANNTDVGGIDTAEGMLPSKVNDAIREVMSHLADFADGTEAITALDVNGTVTADGLTLGDNNKAIFGAGSDMSLFHNGNNAFLDNDTGTLFIQTNGFSVKNAAGTESMMLGAADGAVTLYHNNVAKLATTSSGIDVQGSVTADEFVADSAGTLGNSQMMMDFSAPNGRLQVKNASGAPAANMFFLTTDSAGNTRNRVKVDDAGDFVLYADNGTTEGLFWDASTQRLGLGTTAPSDKLHVSGTVRADYFRPASNQTDPNDGSAYIYQQSGIGWDFAALNLKFSTGTAGNRAERMRITSGGSVGIGTASPSEVLTVAASGSSARISITDTDNTKATMVGVMEFDGTDGRNGYVGPVNGDMTINTDGGYPIKFQTNGTERMRIDGATGNLLVGKTSSLDATTTVGHFLSTNGVAVHTRDGSAPLRVARTTSDGEIISLHKDNTTVASIGAVGGSVYIASPQGTDAGIQLGNSIVSPATTTGANRDNAIDLGWSANRFDDIYATNGTIQTSDENEKQQIANLTNAEITAAKAISKLFKTFKWNDSVAANGDNARTHTGVVAQDVEAAMTAAGLDAGDYAFFISTTWWEADGETYYNADDAPEGATQHNRKGIRYPELLSFIGAATEQRLSNIESRLAALEAN